MADELAGTVARLRELLARRPAVLMMDFSNPDAGVLCAEAVNSLPALLDALEAATAREARLRAAVEFYADASNWIKSEDAWGYLLQADEEGPRRAAAALAGPAQEGEA